MFADDDMRSLTGGGMLYALIPERDQVDPRQEMFARAEKHRRNGKMHLVDQTFLQILPDGLHASTDPDIFIVGCRFCLLERGMDPVGNEMERGAAFHLYGRASVVRQHEHVAMERWVVAPPAFPFIVRPRTSDRSEHIAPQDLGSDILEAAPGKVVVDSCCTALFPKHLMKCLGLDQPCVQTEAADPKGILQVLIRSCSVTIDR